MNQYFVAMCSNVNQYLVASLRHLMLYMEPDNPGRRGSFLDHFTIDEKYIFGILGEGVNNNVNIY